MKKVELLAPAGSVQKAKIAFMYGADAVYAGTAKLSLRTRAEMNSDTLHETIEYAHSIGKKVYVALNIYARDNDYSEIEEEIKKLKRAKADPIIAPSKGQVLWEVSVEGPSSAPFIGRKYQHDEVFCYVSTPWGEYEKIMTGFTGRVVEVCAQQGANVNKGDVIAYIQRSDIFA